MTTVTSPSPMFPASPRVSVDLPEGWEAVQRAGSLLAAQGSGEAYASSIVARAALGGPGADIDQALREVEESAAAVPEGVTSPPFRCVISGLTFVGLDRSWVEEGVGSVIEVHLFHATAPLVEHGASHLVRLIGSCAGARVREDYALLRRVLLAASVAPWQPPVPEEAR